MKNVEDSIWYLYHDIVENNKKKRGRNGLNCDEEPKELEFDYDLMNACDSDGKKIYFHKKDLYLLSCFWVQDLFGNDWITIQKIVNPSPFDLCDVGGNLYYRESFIQNLIDVLFLLADTNLVTKLRLSQKTFNKECPSVYNNQEMMRILNVKENTLRGYRDNGLLGYSKCGDKIWYTEKNLKDFLEKDGIVNYPFN